MTQMQMDQNTASNCNPLVLLVDDQSIELELNNIALKANYATAEVLCFESGSGVLDYVRTMETQVNRPVLMVLDLKMPALNGFDVLEILIGENLKQFPVVILSSSSLPEDVRRAKQLGADDYLEKPIGFKANLELFDQLLRKFILLMDQFQSQTA